MKKRFCVTFLLCLILGLTAVLSACDNGSTTTPTKLVMGELTYDDTTKIVSWDKVANASGYALKIDGTEKSGVTESGNKMQYTISQSTSGDYTVSVVAKGDGTNYSNSDAKTKTITYTAAASGEKTQVTLVMGALSYDDTTKIVSWDKVAGASGYTLRVGSSVKSSDLITENGNKMKYTMTESSSGEYTVRVKAIGSETATHIYADSVEVNDVFYFTKPASKGQVQLDTPSLGFDNATGTVYFNAVNEAESYEFKIDGITETATFNSGTNRYEYTFTENGEYTATVKALGYETATHIFLESGLATKACNYTQSQTGDVTYAEIVALVEEKAEVVWKIDKLQSQLNGYEGVGLKGINIETGIAYIIVETNNAGRQFRTLNLGALAGTLADMKTQIENTTYVSADLVSIHNNLDNATNTTNLIAALKANGEITGNAIWAVSTVFGGGAGNRSTNVTVALDNGTLVTLTLTVGTISSGSAAVIYDYTNGLANGTVSNKTTTAYADLSTLAA